MTFAQNGEGHALLVLGLGSIFEGNRFTLDPFVGRCALVRAGLLCSIGKCSLPCDSILDEEIQ